MNEGKLPVKLNKNPLIEVVFECRFSSESSATHILPSLIMGKNQDKKAKFTKLPNQDIPEVIRNQDLDLKYIPLVQVELEEYRHFIGDNSYAISSKMPYQGWIEFKKHILSSLEMLTESKVTKSIERFSIKYVDILEANSFEEQISSVDISIRIGENSLTKEPYDLAVKIDKTDFFHILKVVVGAEAKTNDSTVKGIVIDIDTIKPIKPNTSLNNIMDNISESLEAMHREGKYEFFRLLSSKKLEDLEPVYD